MEKALHASICALSLDRGQVMTAWLAAHPDEPLTWVERCHQAFSQWLGTQERPLRDLVDHRAGTRLAANRMFLVLGADPTLEAEIEWAEADAKRYLSWLGFRNVHLLVIGRIRPRPPTLQTDLHPAYILARQLKFALTTILLKQYYSKAGAFGPDLHLAALIISLALWDGALSPAEIKAALLEITGGRIRRIDSLLYIVCPLQADGGHVRRLFLSPLTVSLALSLPPNALGESTAKAISHALRTVPQDWLPVDAAPLKLRALVEAGIVFLRLQPDIPHHVVDYAAGLILSDSVCEDRFVQLLGRKPQPSQETVERAPRPGRSAPLEAEEPCSSVTERPGIINALKKKLDPNRTPDATNAALNLIRTRRAEGVKAMIGLLFDWVEWMLTKRELQPSTALINLTSLSQHLMPLITDMDQTISSPDHWEPLFEAMTTGMKPEDKIFDAVRLMAQYLESRTGEKYGDAGMSAQADINARILSEAEISRCINLLHQRLPEGRALKAERLVLLAFHLGCRRWELLGLQTKDVRGEIDPYINLHDNDLRDLKTLASKRVISLRFVQKEAFYQDWRAAVKQQAILRPTDSIFQDDGFIVREDEKVLFLEINKALQAACNNPDASFHSLRHSTACRELLAIYWEKLALTDMEAYPYFAEIQARVIRIRAILLQENLMSRFEHETVSHQLGHLSYDTTARHYFHFYCLMRFGLLRKAHGWLNDPDMPKVCLAAAGMNRQSQAVRKASSLALPNALEIVAEKYADRLDTYQQWEVIVDGIDAKAAKPLLRELQLISTLAQREEHERTALLLDLVPDGEEPNAYIDAMNRRIDTMTDLMNQVTRNKKGPKAFWQISANAPARISLLNMSERFSALTAEDHGNQRAADLVIGLKHLVGHRCKQLGAAFRFKTGEQARRLLVYLTDLFGTESIEFETLLETSQRSGSAVAKVLIEKGTFTQISDIDHTGTGNLVVRVVLREESSFHYKPESLIWFCATAYVKFGDLEKNKADGQ